MKAKGLNIFAFILFVIIGFIIGSWVIDNSKLRQLTKDKLKLEIQLLKIQIELNEINIQKEY